MKISSILLLLCLTSSSMAKYLPLHLDQASQVASGCSPTTPILMVLFLITLLVGKLFILYPHSYRYNNKTAVKKVQISPTQTAFVFDLHGVVFRFNPLQAARHAVVTPHKKVLFWAAINPFLIWDVLKLLHNSAVVEEAIMAIGHKYPNLKEVIPLALKMANEQLPIEPTISLIKQLKQQGFKIFIFSNIGEKSAQILQHNHPEIFALFDGILFTSAQDNYLMKPSEDAFLKFLNKFKLQKEQIIFIDDKQSNVHVARKMGISALQFINPYQCGLLLKRMITSPS